MKKLLKHKNLIVFILVFILSFGIFADYKKKEAQAFDFVITPTMLWALGTLVLATGVVAVSGDQIVDMGQRVVDRINDNAKLRGQMVFDGAVAVGLKIDSFIKDAVKWVSENLSDTDVQTLIDVPFGPSFTLKHAKKDYRVPHLYFSVSNGSSIDLVYHYSGEEYNTPLSDSYTEYRITSMMYKTGIFSYTPRWYLQCNDNGQWRNYAGSLCRDDIANDIADFYFRPRVETSDDISGLIGGLKKEVVIPYSNPAIKENYNPTYTDNNLPYDDVKQGYIPIPTDIPIDTPISSDLPLTWDNVKDTVIPLPVDPTEAPSIPDVGEYELPSDLPLDDTGDITKGGIIGGIVDFFSWLWELLKAILMGIWNLLKAILDLLLGLVNALLTGLKDLLIDLFVPSDTYFTDVFEGFKSSLFQKLDITSYTRLFDTDYTESSIKDITINIFGKTVTIVRFSMFEEFREIVNTLIYAFMFFLLAIYNYNQIYKLIRGSDYVSASTTITHMGGGLTPAEQLKADSINRRVK